MQSNKCNRSIGCTVDSCKYHNGRQNYCSLDNIQIGAHELNPKTPQCVDCQSFESKS